MTRSALLASCFGFWLTLAPGAPGGTLSPGEVLISSFTTVPNTANVLGFSFNSVPLSFTGSPVVTAELYDGTTVLASFSQAISLPDSDYFSVDFGTAAGFASVPFRSPDNVVADFTSFNNGAIQGELEITVSGGSISGFNLPGDTYLFAGTLFNEGDFAGILPPDPVTSTPFSINSTPEPGSSLLAGVGVLLLVIPGIWRRRIGAMERRQCVAWPDSLQAVWLDCEGETCSNKVIGPPIAAHPCSTPPA